MEVNKPPMRYPADLKGTMVGLRFHKKQKKQKTKTGSAAVKTGKIRGKQTNKPIEEKLLKTKSRRPERK